MGSFIDQYSKEELTEIVSNSFSYAEVILKLGYSTNSGRNQDTIKKRLEHYGISTEHFAYRPAKRDWTDDEIFCEDSKVSQNKLRRAFKGKNVVPYRCAICDLPPLWNQQPLTMTLDHINGKNKDNRLENLRWICPNCDRQLSTYGTKNKKKLTKGVMLASGNYDSAPSENEIIEEIISDKLPKIQKDTKGNTRKNKPTKYREKIPIPDRNELKDKLWECKNFMQVGSFYNVTDNLIRKWCRSYNLPATTDVIKHTSDQGWTDEQWNDIPRKQKSPATPPAPCYMVDIESEQILMEFASRSEAGKYIAPASKRAAIHIGHVCNGLRKSAYGYLWRDKEEKNIS